MLKVVVRTDMSNGVAKGFARATWVEKVSIRMAAFQNLVSLDVWGSQWVDAKLRKP